MAKPELGKTYRRKDMPHVWIRADRFWREHWIEGLTHEGYRHIVSIGVLEEDFEYSDE